MALSEKQRQQRKQAKTFQRRAELKFRNSEAGKQQERQERARRIEESVRVAAQVNFAAMFGRMTR